jgi:hypothetical protein
MNKKQFIWLVIRFVGMIYLFLVVSAILLLYGSLYTLISSFPWINASSYLTSYVVFYQAMAGLSTILIAAYLLFYGNLIYRIVDKVSAGDSDCGLNNHNYVEILTRFMGVYFLWCIVCRLCTALYAAMMLIRFKFASEELHEIVSKNDTLSQYFKSLWIQFSWHALFWIIALAALTYYFLKNGELVMSIFHRRWLPGEPQAPTEKKNDMAIEAYSPDSNEPE